MAIKTVIENFAKARDEYEARSKALGKEAQEQIAKAIAEVLPAGHVFIWTQATPYFNDGDACVFRVNSSYVLTDERYQADADAWDGIEIGYGSGKRGQFADLAAVWAKLEAKSNRALMLAAFGDHAMVIVKPDGTFARESYDDHD